MSGTIDWNRDKQRRQMSAEAQRIHEGNELPHTFRTKYGGECHSCGLTIEIGEQVVSTYEAGVRVYHHRACICSERITERIYRSDAVLDPTPCTQPRPHGRTVLQTKGRRHVRICKGVTVKGKPCGAAAQRRFDYCGTHFDQRIAEATVRPVGPCQAQTRAGVERHVR